MKPATVKQLKDELQHRSPVELMQLTLRLSKFKKENKELLSYLLFYTDEQNYITEVKEEVDELFEAVNTSSYYFMKKSIRKILRLVKKYSRYSTEKETEVALHVYFCQKMKAFYPSIFKSRALSNLYDRQVDFTTRKMESLHEDLQYEFRVQLEELES